MTDLDERLDDRLQRLGDDLDRLSRTRRLGTVTAARRPHLAAVAVGGLVAASVVGLIAIASLRDPRPASPAAEPAAPRSYDPSVFAGSQACLNGMEQYRADTPPELRADVVLPDPDDASFVGLPQPGSDSQVHLLIYDDAAMVTCIVDRSAGPDDLVLPDSVGSPGPPPIAPSAAQVTLVDVGGASEALGIGPGNTLYIGRAGEDVAGVEAILPDGTTAAGVLSDGWFIIDAPVADGVELHYGNQITWTLDDGETRSAPATELLQR